MLRSLGADEDEAALGERIAPRRTVAEADEVRADVAVGAQRSWLSRRARRVKDRGIVVGPEDDIGQWCVGLHRADGVLERDRAGDRVAPGAATITASRSGSSARCSPMRSARSRSAIATLLPESARPYVARTRPPRVEWHGHRTGCGSTQNAMLHSGKLRMAIVPDRPVGHRGLR